MSSKKTVKRKGLLAQVNTSAGLQYRMGNVEQNIHNTKTELEFEIECPRCVGSCHPCFLRSSSFCYSLIESPYSIITSCRCVCCFCYDISEPFRTLSCYVTTISMSIIIVEAHGGKICGENNADGKSYLCVYFIFKKK